MCRFAMYIGPPIQLGPFAFMHNGSVGGFAQLRRKLREGLSDRSYDAIEGSTDSEHVLALLSDRYLAIDGLDPLERISRALDDTIALLEQLRRQHEIEAPSYLNLAMTDGHVAAATRYVSHGHGPAHSLYVARGRLRVEEGDAEIVDHGAGEPAVLVASEPLGHRDRWEVVAENHLLRIDDNRELELRPL